ncbi:MAG: hypothetical protein ACP5GZ_01130 [Vulcanisaeta sp.]|uniref:hypothetical protein n=1 Tax=Vulcanisaeta sp. TaxID=2020871 RepID=UPI003D14DF78
MRQVLITLSLILPIIPFIAIIPSSPLLSLIIIGIVFSTGLIGLLINNLTIESWFSLILALIISLISQGYIPFIFHVVLIPLQNPELFNGLVIMIEYSLVSSQLYKSYMKYIKEFGSRGFDKNEVNYALNNLVKWIMSFLTIALAISLTIYYIMVIITIPLVDPFTALVIFAITYITISRYLLTKMRSS